MANLIAIGSFGVAIISALCFLALAAAYARNERKQKARLRQAETDMADMMLLFRTMRDIVGQQKELAREFNATLDRKMAAVKQILGKSLEKNEKLYERQQRLGAELDEARAQLESLQRQLLRQRGAAAPGNQARPERSGAAARMAALADEVGREFGRAAAPQAAAAQSEAAPDPVKPAAATPPPTRRAQDLADEASLADTGVTNARFEAWVGAELARALDPGPPPEPEAEDPEPPSAPVSPAERTAARDAFRDLIDLGAPTDAPEEAAPAESPGTAEAAADRNGGGGSLRQRVLEYHDAGMSVAGISRELGIGKGEVRLMLSLARQEPR